MAPLRLISVQRRFGRKLAPHKEFDTTTPSEKRIQSPYIGVRGNERYGSKLALTEIFDEQTVMRHFFGHLFFMAAYGNSMIYRISGKDALFGNLQRAKRFAHIRQSDARFRSPAFVEVLESCTVYRNSEERQVRLEICHARNI